MLSDQTAVITEIANAVLQEEELRLIRPLDPPARENQLVCFLKPEVFFPKTKTRELVELALGTLRSYEVGISGVLTIRGSALERLGIMDAHYGYINHMSRMASRSVAQDEAENLRRQTGAKPGTPILGGHEVLEKFPGLTAASLDRLWATKKSLKIRSGFYFHQYEIDSEPFVIVNGFHPEQLAHFTAHDRRIALLVLDTNLPWRFMRSRILGDTFPERALRGTIRRQVFDKASFFGFDTVSIANNCVHMSAGPFEGAFELQNFYGRLGAAGYGKDGSNVGKRLASAGKNIEKALSNPVATINDSSVTLFDATEEVDTTGALELYTRLFS